MPIGDRPARVRLGGRLRQAFTTTRGRLILLWVTIFAAALTVANVGIYLAATVAEHKAVDAELRSQAASVSSQIEVVGSRPTYVHGDLPDETRGGFAIELALVDSRQILQQTPDQPLSASDLRSLATPALRSGQPSITDFYDARHVHRRAYVAPLDAIHSQPVVLVASTSLKPVESTVMLTTGLAAALSLAVLAGSVVLVHWMIGRVLSPVRKIANLAESLSEHDLHRRVDVTAPDDEVGQLVMTFNRMLARLEGSFAALRSFTADASHELRSPLTLMGTELEYVLTGRRPALERERALRVLQEEVQHMTRMVETLLMLARVDAGQLRPARQQLNVFDFIHETAARWQTTAAEKEVNVEVEVPDSGTMLADPSLTRRILDNLIDNAIRHSPTGSRLRIGASRCDGDWSIEVRDQGPGVSPGQRGRVFERFAREDSARTRGRSGGAGLGLPLSLAVARLQGGDLTLVDRPGWGAVFQARIADAGTDDEPPRRR